MKFELWVDYGPDRDRGRDDILYILSHFSAFILYSSLVVT